MARKKVRIAYITNNSARRATFRKRKEGMMKKLRELTTLCGIDACAVIYSPFDSQPAVWPSPSGVKNVLEKFKNMSLIEKSQKMLNQESFLRELISKRQMQLKKLRKENKEKQLKHVMFESLTVGIPQFHNLNLMDMGVLQQLIYQILEEIDRKAKNHDEMEIDNENQTPQVAPGACNNI